MLEAGADQTLRLKRRATSLQLGCDSVKLAQHVEDFFVVGLLTDVVDVFVNDLTLFVDDKERAFSEALRPVSSKLGSDSSFGLKV